MESLQARQVQVHGVCSTTIIVEESGGFKGADDGFKAKTEEEGPSCRQPNPEVKTFLTPRAPV